MAELVYPPVIGLAKGLFRYLGLRFTITGTEHVPRSGGAVMAINHVGYLDFTFAGLAALPAGRKVRFMAKESVFHHWLAGPLMRGMKHIPVDRRKGAASFDAALAALGSGEIIGVFPEATISRSFELKEFKSGVARLAEGAGVPVLPTIIWGSQRIWTKDRPRRLRRDHVPVSIAVGEPVTVGAGTPAAETVAEVKQRMAALLETVQQAYPTPPDSADRWWQPARIGGTAPTPEQATALDSAEAERRRAKRAGRPSGQA
jgi:1-acyl-sn-glycerol-3-phosphate acyltransferase